MNTSVDFSQIINSVEVDPLVREVTYSLTKEGFLDKVFKIKKAEWFINCAHTLLSNVEDQNTKLIDINQIYDTQTIKTELESRPLCEEIYQTVLREKYDLVWDKIVDLNESINNCLKSMSNEQETWPELKDDLMISGYRLRNNAGNITPIDTHIVGNNITSKEKLPELKLFTVPPPPQTPLSPSSGSRTNLWRGSQTLENIWGAPIIDQKQSSAYLLPYPTIGQPTRPVDPARGPVRLNQDSNFAINLREIKSSVEMAAAEPGQMVYYTGGQVPKIALTTGTKSWPSVPLNCRMWTPSNNYKKYSILNPKLMNMNESRPQYSQYYYVDDICARENGLMEDFSRNFRMPSRNHGDKKTWSGYNVYDCASFGDSLELAGQLRSIKTESARDLYQFALWFMVVAMAHHQVENE